MQRTLPLDLALPPRLPDWRRRLFALLQESLRTPFVWGTHDCVLLAAKGVDAQLGTAWYDDVRVRFSYTDEAQARAVLAAAGGLEAMVTSYLGTPVMPSWCGAGSVVLTALGERQLLCLHDGTKLVGPDEVGLRRVPMALAVCGWRLG